MIAVPLEAGALFALLVFVVVVMRYELGMSVVVSGLLAISVMATGLLFALSLQLFAGLSLLHTAGALGVVLMLMALSYEMMNVQGRPG